MAAKTTTKPEQATIAPEFIIPDLSEMMDGFDMKRVLTKFAIGYAFAITGWIASWQVAVTIALLTSVVWLQYVIAFAVFALCLVGVVYATPLVTNAVYDAGAWVATKTKSLFTSAKEKVNFARFVGDDVVKH